MSYSPPLLSIPDMDMNPISISSGIERPMMTSRQEFKDDVVLLPIPARSRSSKRSRVVTSAALPRTNVSVTWQQAQSIAEDLRLHGAHVLNLPVPNDEEIRAPPLSQLNRSFSTICDEEGYPPRRDALPYSSYLSHDPTSYVTSLYLPADPPDKHIVELPPLENKIILFLPGNDMDTGALLTDMSFLKRLMNCAVICLIYPGYDLTRILRKYVVNKKKRDSAFHNDPDAAQYLARSSPTGMMSSRANTRNADYILSPSALSASSPDGNSTSTHSDTTTGRMMSRTGLEDDENEEKRPVNSRSRLQTALMHASVLVDFLLVDAQFAACDIVPVGFSIGSGIACALLERFAMKRHIFFPLLSLHSPFGNFSHVAAALTLKHLGIARNQTRITSLARRMEAKEGDLKDWSNTRSLKNVYRLNPRMKLIIFHCPLDHIVPIDLGGGLLADSFSLDRNDCVFDASCVKHAMLSSLDEIAVFQRTLMANANDPRTCRPPKLVQAAIARLLHLADTTSDFERVFAKKQPQPKSSRRPTSIAVITGSRNVLPVILDHDER